MQIFQTGKSCLPHHATRRGLCRDLATGNGNERKWSSAGGNITVCLGVVWLSTAEECPDWPQGMFSHLPLTASLPHVWNITSCFLAPFLHCIAIAVVDNEGVSLKPAHCEPRLGGGIWRNIELNLSFNWKMFSKVVFLSWALSEMFAQPPAVLQLLQGADTQIETFNHQPGLITL